MDKRKTIITILGGGISGLATAYWLDKAGLNVTVLEANNEPGGSMVTRREEAFLIDYGPNSGLDTTPLIGQMAEELGLMENLIYADETAARRYILKNGQLHALPTNPLAFLKTDLFSFKAKLRLLAEPFMGRSDDGYYQSISQFVKRRLGQEFLDYAVNPFVAGVFAGNPDELSVKSAFPKLYRLEELYGGLIKGLIKGVKERKQRAETSKQNARMFSFKNGMQALPGAIATKLNKKIKFNCNVEKVIKSGSRYTVLYNQSGKPMQIDTDIIVSAIPAYNVATVFGEYDRQLYQHLTDIYYPPVKVLFLGYRKTAIGRPLDGFGFLIPEKEKRSFLGAIWSSTIFPGRSQDSMAAFTLFVGGARSPELLENDADLLFEKILGQFHEIMQIDAPPVFIKERMWPRAIPQYTLGYIEHEKYFEKFERNNPGIFLSGNFRGGISVGDCIKNSGVTCSRINEYLEIC